MTVRASRPATCLFVCGLALMAATVCGAADPPKPGANKPPEVDQARAEVLATLEQFRDAETPCARPRGGYANWRENRGRPPTKCKPKPKCLHCGTPRRM